MSDSQIRQLQITDLQLATCSRWRAPDGVSILPVPHVLPFFYQISAGAAQDGVELATHPEFPFQVKVISSTCLTPGTLVRVQWPDGRYLSNPGIDFFSFVRTGRLGRLIHPHKILPPGQKVRFDLDNSGVGSAAVIELYLEGVLLVPMVGGSNGC